MFVCLFVDVDGLCFDFSLLRLLILHFCWWFWILVRVVVWVFWIVFRWF